MEAVLCPCLCGVVLSSDRRYAPYLICPSCGSGWTDLRPGEHWADESPSQEQLTFWGSRADQWKVATGGRTRGRVLDVGCGFGHFVSWAAEQGWDAWGTEPGDAARAQSVAPGRRVVPELTDVEGRFDLITLWDVLEHVREPAAFVRVLTDLLNPGGTLFVCSPDFAALRVRWPLLTRRPEAFARLVRPHEHFSQFSGRGLQHLLRGCDLAEVRRLHPPLARGPRPLRRAAGRLPLLRTGQFVVGSRR